MCFIFMFIFAQLNDRSNTSKIIKLKRYCLKIERGDVTLAGVPACLGYPIAVILSIFATAETESVYNAYKNFSFIILVSMCGNDLTSVHLRQRRICRVA